MNTGPWRRVLVGGRGPVISIVLGNTTGRIFVALAFIGWPKLSDFPITSKQ